MSRASNIIYNESNMRDLQDSVVRMLSKLLSNKNDIKYKNVIKRFGIKQIEDLSNLSYDKLIEMYRVLSPA